MYTHTHTHTYTYIPMYICIYVHISEYKCACVHAREKEGDMEGRRSERKRAEGHFSLTPRPSLKKRHVENDVLLVFQN